MSNSFGQRQTNKLFKRLLVVLFLLGTIFSFNFAEAAANPQINYQGKLTNPSGVAVSDGTYNMRFWLLTSDSIATSSALWTESLTGANKVTVSNGLFSIMLGSTTALTAVDFNQTLYLGVEIGGTSTPVWDGEMSPRKILGTVPAAFVAGYADVAGAASSSDDALALSGIASSSFLRSDEADTMEATSSSAILSIIQNGAGAVARFFSGLTEVFTILNNGNVGIGSSTPSTKLAVGGDAIVTGTSTFATTTTSALSADTIDVFLGPGNGFIFNNQGFTIAGNTGLVISDTDGQKPFRLVGNRSGDSVLFHVNGNQYFSSKSVDFKVDQANEQYYFGNGSILMGTTTSSGKLTVAGDTFMNGSLSITGAFKDSTNASGTVGQLLQTTGNSTKWIATSTLGLGDGTFLGLTDTPSSYTANRILFTNSSANAVTDSANFVFDGTNLGIGSTTPSARLTVQGNAGQANVATFASSTGSTTLALLANGNLELPGQLISAGINWTAQTSASSTASFNSITYGNGLFVAVSWNGDRVMTSPDGITWTARSAAGNDDSWNSVVYGNGLFVAVGNGLDYVMTSPDGITWTPRSAAGDDDEWYGITYGNGLFVAVGYYGDPIMTSPDGITWTPRSAAGNNDFWQSITYGNGLFVAVSYFGDRVMTSPDGIIWTPRSATGDDDSWSSVVYGNGLFVAVGNSGDRVMTSPDGIIWTPRSVPEANAWRVVAYGNGIFVAVSEDGTNRVMTSGKINERQLAHNNIYQGGASFMGGLRAGTTSTSVASSIFLQSEAGKNPFAIASSSGTELFSILQNGNVGIGTSTPSSKLSVGGDTYIAGNLTASGLTALNNLTANNATTTDLNTANLSLAGTLRDSTNTTGTLGMILQTTGTSTRWIATSTLGLGDGTFLGLTDTPASYTANRILFTNSSANAITDSTNFIFDGTNLGIGSTTPSARLTVQGSAGQANIATFASSTGSTTLALLSNGNLELPGQLVSAGIEWTPHSAAGNDDGWYGITYGNGLFVSVANSGTDRVMTSPDGINWTARSAAGNDDAWYGITYGNGLFVAVGNGPDRVMTSPDGINWTARSAAGNDDAWSGITYGNGMFVAVGYFGDRIITSPDGITWTPRSAAGDDDSWRSVTYANGLFVAVGNSGDRVITSPDGITWTARSAAGNDDHWYDITYGNGLFVAVGYFGDLVMTSPDGSTWTARSAAGNNDGWYDITYGNGLFVVVGFSGDRVMTSPDGINWTARSAVGNDDGWSEVIYGNGMFVAVANSGTDRVMTSGKINERQLAHNNIFQGGASFMGGLRAGTTSTSVASSIFLQSEVGKNPFAIASSSGTELFSILQNGNVGIGSSTPEGKLAIQNLNFGSAGVAGINQYFTMNNGVASAVQYGNYSSIVTSNTATTTIVGNMFKIADSTTFGNTIRGLEVQTDKGTNTQGENTALSGFARTFGVRGTTQGDAGSSYEPAGVYGETLGTTQGNALRGYSSTITTASLLKLFQDTSTFTGTGLLMNFGNAGGSFSSTTASRFIDLKNGGTSKFTVGAYGMLTIGDGSTTTNAGIQIGYGGLCVDNDGSCNASTTGRISSVSTATGNSDLAEMYFASESLQPGEVVYLKGGLSVGLAGTTTREKVLGVVSTLPGVIMGQNDTSLISGETAYPIALAGRVPVRLSNENGDIKAGDELMVSSIPGVVMKASSTGIVVGRALEDFISSRAYSDTYINQFGESIITPEYVPINRVEDERIDDGCYFGGGRATGEETCIPLKATTPAEQYDEADALARAAAKAAALEVLRAEQSVVVTLESGEAVQVGQIVMFVDLHYRYLDEERINLLAALLATTTTPSAVDEGETIWERLVNLANNFVDGVLRILTLKADRVETKELCVDGVCVNANDLQILLNNAGSGAGTGAGTGAAGSDGGAGTGADLAPPNPPEPGEGNDGTGTGEGTGTGTGAGTGTATGTGDGTGEVGGGQSGQGGGQNGDDQNGEGVPPTEEGGGTGTTASSTDSTTEGNSNEAGNGNGSGAGNVSTGNTGGNGNGTTPPAPLPIEPPVTPPPPAVPPTNATST